MDRLHVVFISLIVGISTIVPSVLVPASIISYTSSPASVLVSATPSNTLPDAWNPRILTAEAATMTTDEPAESTTVSSYPHSVPFYSQFTDITPVEWRKIGCGIAALAMLIDFYTDAVPVDSLLSDGIASGAYITDAGWSHQGLINLAAQYDLTGATRGLASLSMDDAFHTLTTAVEEGPVMVSVHYTFDPQNPIPHLVVVTGVADGLVYYNDPAEAAAGGTVSVEQFQSAWKKRYIEIRPTS